MNLNFDTYFKKSKWFMRLMLTQITKNVNEFESNFKKSKGVSS